MVVGIYFVNVHWPYRYRNVKPLLESVLASKVTITHYHRTYFPDPGFVATELTLRRNAAQDLPPVGSTRALMVQGSWMDLLLFRKRVRLVDIAGLHVVIPAVGSRANHEDFPAGSSADFAGPSTVVAELHIHESLLDIMRADGGRYSYPIRDLVIRNLRSGHTISYSVDMQNASPTGRIQATGRFGPLTPKNLGATPVSGRFTFSPVNLGEIGELRGTLSAEGHFSGALSAIEGFATASTPDFAVGSGKPVALSGSLQCTVNGLDSDVILHQIVVKTGETVIDAGGEDRGSPKVADLDVTVARGRAQDLLRPFLQDEAPITGLVWLKAHAHVAAADRDAEFLQRLSVDGGFDVPDERLTNRATERTLSAFSQRAQEAKPSNDDDTSGSSADVLSSVEGKVTIRDGMVSTKRLTFQIPGADANLNGTYNLRNGTVHLVGNLRMKSDISHTATGFKSFLLKPLIPFFKKKKAGAVVPIVVKGGPERYQVTQNVVH